jgi:hypothetical protein
MRTGMGEEEKLREMLRRIAQERVPTRLLRRIAQDRVPARWGFSLHFGGPDVAFCLILFR